jgi:predicted nucleic acid-binding protein
VAKVADRVFLDTNVLLAATDEGRDEHTRAVAILNDWPADGIALYASGQVLREYLCVATREIVDNGLGLARSDAIANVVAFRDRLSSLDENGKVVDRLLDLLENIDCRGKQAHDANVVATMLVHGVETLVTANEGDFKRFAEHIRITPL